MAEGIPESEVGVHSLRSGGASALNHASGGNKAFVQRLGRWASEAFQGYIWEDRTLTVSLLTGPAAAEAEAQIAAEAAATNAAQLAAARAQLDGASGISVAGHPQPAFNGLYTHDSTHEGWPVLKNASGMYCYRYTPADRWLLRNVLTPD